ncbi:hypothetical protein TIFTF001_016811 [Ficus carica]|uniref:Uncharacterized protein n=1 Tax=Ficus carica TaxID=3494 RepID=A0AA88A9E9_FICCA|nr:hypothetical protein TIFTF001_016811 [Ficus carica]
MRHGRGLERRPRGPLSLEGRPGEPACGAAVCPGLGFAGLVEGRGAGVPLGGMAMPRPLVGCEGSTHVIESFVEYVVNHGKVILLLVEAIDVYLLGTVMLVFGMGLYELFVSNLDMSHFYDVVTTAVSCVIISFRIRYPLNQPSSSVNSREITSKSEINSERPKWLDIKTVNELKTKLGHVIVMLLLIGLFDKSKKAAINSPLDLLCFSASILLSSGCLFLLSKLND